ncbi:hypothetical protein BST61_g1742 [Cercospora zeina]
MLTKNAGHILDRHVKTYRHKPAYTAVAKTAGIFLIFGHASSFPMRGPRRLGSSQATWQGLLYGAQDSLLTKAKTTMQSWRTRSLLHVRHFPPTESRTVETKQNEHWHEQDGREAKGPAYSDRAKSSAT